MKGLIKISDCNFTFLEYRPRSEFETEKIINKMKVLDYLKERQKDDITLEDYQMNKVERAEYLQETGRNYLKR